MKYLWMMTLVSSAFAYNFQEQTQNELNLFNQDPDAYYRQDPTLITARPQEENYVFDKIAFRYNNFDMGLIPKSGILPNDQVRNLVYNRDSVVSNFNTINSSGLTRAAVIANPWSGHFFPIYRGLIGARYNERGFNQNNGKWISAYRYVHKYPAETIYNSRNIDAINLLSPAEKYDLVMGTDFTLTRFMWAEGKKYFDKEGDVEKWMGICHGWSPASFMYERPTKSITVPSARYGLPITFYPADIKALASLIWAYNVVKVNIIGGRCNEETPRTDRGGRTVNPNCTDTNPGTFHLAITNQIGLNKKPVIIDTAWDYEVWNAPIVAYKLLYFNPYTNKIPQYINEAIVDAHHATRTRRWFRTRTVYSDRLRHYRANGTKWLVGVSAEITYAVETNAVQRQTDSSEHDRNNRVIYTYDLELDENYNIVGGEWRKQKHPDFLWTPKENTEMLTQGDRNLLNAPAWDGQSRVPSQWSFEATNEAAKGTPLGLVVEKFIELSRN